MSQTDYFAGNPPVTAVKKEFFWVVCLYFISTHTHPYCY
jgi:hypothetical protein